MAKLYTGKSCINGSARSGPEFHVNYGSGRVWSFHSFVGRVGSGQENWTHVQL